MIAFWSFVAALVGIALAFLIVPLARKAKSTAQGPTRAEYDLTVYKDQLTEIDRDLDRSVLSPDQALAARTEIERRMLNAAGDQNSGLEVAETSNRKSAMALMVAVFIVVPLGAVGFYMYLGQPQLPDQPLANRTQDTQNQTPQHAGASEEDRARARQLLAELEQRLEQNPKDIEGWLVLAQIYEATNRYGDAAGAYEKVVNLTDRHPEALTAWAEAQIVAEDTVVLPGVTALLKEVKAKDPSEPRAYFYLALERQQHQDLQGAMAEYVQLLKVSPSDAEWIGQIQNRMQALAVEMGGEVPVVQMLPPTGPPSSGLATGPGNLASGSGASAAAAGPSQEQVRDAQQMSPEDQQAMIETMVQRLADKLKENPDDVAGWKRLAQAYRVLGDATKAAEAEAQIKRLSGQ